MEGVPAAHQAPVPVPVVMEGVVATVSVLAFAPQEDPIEDGSEMEGIEREGMFASQHAPELGVPTVSPAPVPEGWRKEKRKGKGREVQIAVPLVTTQEPARKLRGSHYQ